MGYLNEVFNTYYYSNDKKQKQNLKNGFKNIIWSSLPYIKQDRFFKYKISYNNIINVDDLEILEKYKYIEYKILKSRYNINNLTKEDLIRARINSNYGKHFDKEVYLKKEYYKALANYRNIYFKYLKGEIEDLSEEINKNNKYINKLKEESLEVKCEMNWKDYKNFINMCFDRIFDNYKPVDEKVGENKFYPNHILDWDSDNYIVGYINKSLNGYLKNYINELKKKRKKKKYKQCCICNVMIEVKSNRTKYCEDCAREIKKKQNLEIWHKNKNKYKTRKIENAT